MTSTAATTTATTLAPHQLRTWMDEHRDLLIIDVRSAAEFAAMHITGSYNVPLALLAEHAEEVAARAGANLVLVCQSGVRAEQARLRLAAAGVDAAPVLMGGVPAFERAGGAVVRGQARWDLERQVRLVAGSLVVLGLAGGRFVSPKLRLLAGVIGVGLTFSATTNTCAMGKALSTLPWNREAPAPTRETTVLRLPTSDSQGPIAA